MAAKKGLGKGLDSLIPSKPIESAKEVSDQNAVENAKAMVSIDKIEPNAEQPRKAFDEDDGISRFYQTAWCLITTLGA